MRIIDTCVLLSNPESIVDMLPVVVPGQVLYELDTLKKHKPELVNRALDVLEEHFDKIIFGINERSLDREIILQGQELGGTTLVTNDRLFALMARIDKVPYELGGGLTVAEAESWSSEIITRANQACKAYGVTPRDDAQNTALYYMLNPDYKIISVQGRSRLGKTYLALAAALELGKNIVVIKSPLELGPSLGALPGELDEKIAPFFRPIQELLMKFKHKAKVEYFPINYLRGMNFDGCTVLIDEAQNLSRMEMRTALSRLGKDSRAIITADIHQVDNPHLNYLNNGSNWLVKLMKTEQAYAHVILNSAKSNGLVPDMVARVGL
jgi:predicted ribonuclease YlaK